MEITFDSIGGVLPPKRPPVSDRSVSTWQKLPSRLVRIGEAAKYMSMSPWKLRQLVVDRRLPVVQDVEGGPYLFDLRDLDQFIDRNKRGTVR